MYFIQQCFIFTASTESEDAGIEPRPVPTLAVTAKRSNHSARSHLTMHRSWWGEIKREL
jgi:hypothetical protein